MTKIVLCGNPKGGCCPVVDISDNENKVTITDDYGGQVRMTKEQYKLLKTKDA
jgi:hypothetical protein